MILREREIKAIRKTRNCIWCSEPIILGTSAVDVFCHMDGMDPTFGAMHPECFTGGWEKEDWDACDYMFDKGYYHRGCCCEHGNCDCEKEGV